jgi:hypothetical protein
MTAPALPPPTDPGNTLLSNIPFTLVTVVIPQPDGSKIGLATIRCGNATLTLTMDKAVAAAARAAGNGQAAP